MAVEWLYDGLDGCWNGLKAAKRIIVELDVWMFWLFDDWMIGRQDARLYLVFVWIVGRLYDCWMVVWTELEFRKAGCSDDILWADCMVVEWLNGCMVGWKEYWMAEYYDDGRLDVRMIKGWTVGWLDLSMFGWFDGWMVIWSLNVYIARWPWYPGIYFLRCTNNLTILYCIVRSIFVFLVGRT